MNSRNKTATGWSKPERLSDSINTSSSDFYATITNKKYIYFKRWLKFHFELCRILNKRKHEKVSCENELHGKLNTVPNNKDLARLRQRDEIKYLKFY